MAARDFSVSNFMERVDALGGPVKKDRFSVEVTPPRSMASSVNADTINFLAKSASLPGKALATTNYRYGGKFDLVVPYETTQEPVTIKIMNTNAINIPLWKQQIMKLPINIIIYRIWYLICRIL